MKALLSAHRMHAEAIGKWDGDPSPREEGDQPPADRPLIYQYFLYGELCWRSRPDIRIEVKALLDTGCDISSVSTNTVERLDAKLQESTGEMLQLFRTQLAAGAPRPTYDLAFLLPETGHPVSSTSGFLCLPNPGWGSVDMLLGQDLINQWIITYDGIHGTLTIATP
jgi:hypothetical protein